MQTAPNAPSETPPAGHASTNAANARAAEKASGRAAFEAFRKNGSAEAKPPVEAKEESPPEEVEDAPAGAAAEAPEAEQPEVEPVEEQVDPAIAKRLAAAQKEEQRRKERLATERAALKAEQEKARAELEAERKALEADRKALEEFRALRERAKYAPAAVLQHLGLAPEDMAIAAREAWLLSPEGRAAAEKDPSQREAIARMQRERELAGGVTKQGGEVAELRAKLDELNKKLETRDVEQQQQARVNEYLDSVEDAVGDDHPLIASALTSAKARATDRKLPPDERREAQQTVRHLREQFNRIAVELYERDEELPDPADVAAELERRQRAELKRWGVAPGTPAAPKKPAAPPAKTLAPSGGGPTAPKKALTDEEKRARFLRARESGKWDD